MKRQTTTERRAVRRAVNEIRGPLARPYPDPLYVGTPTIPPNQTVTDYRRGRAA